MRILHLFLAGAMILAVGCATDDQTPDTDELTAAIAATSCVDTCTATPLYTAGGTYAGCLTNVNGHEHFSNPQGLTPLGCSTFCQALRESTGICPIEIELPLEPFPFEP